MSTQSRATYAELAAEFERAMGSLAKHPVDDIVVSALLDIWWAPDPIPANPTEALTRIAAIALEGAARLRRGT